MAQYEGLAEIYDTLSEHDYAAWSRYLLDLAGDFDSVLDLACGTGSIAIELAKAGKRVTAVDLSEEMLMVAAQKARKSGVKIDFSNQDMTSFRVHRPVDVIVCNCDSINYITDRRKLRSAFASVAQALKPGGRFIFDILSPYRMENVLGNSFYGADTDEISYIWQNSYDKKHKLLTMDITFFVKQGELYRKIIEEHRQRAYDTDEITAMLEAAGFGEIRAYNAFERKKPREKSDRICFAAVKQEERNER